MAPTSWLEIASPRPVPPYLRVVELSAWVKASKMLACLSAAMPMPSSDTSKPSTTPWAELSCTRTLRDTSPRGVNLIALPIRLVSTWRSRPGSPSSSCGTSCSISQVNSRPPTSALSARIRVVALSSDRRSNSVLSSSILPDSSLEKSRMSLMMVSRASADDFTMPRYSRCSAVKSVSSANSVMPMMPFIGVRISWLMVARKSLLARFACSADSLACVNSSTRSFTARDMALNAVPSCPNSSGPSFTGAGVRLPAATWRLARVRSTRCRVSHRPSSVNSTTESNSSVKAISAPWVVNAARAARMCDRSSPKWS